MPFISNKLFARLQSASNGMSNICYNLYQENSTIQYRKVLEESWREWDAAKEAIRYRLINKEDFK